MGIGLGVASVGLTGSTGIYQGTSQNIFAGSQF